MADILVAIVVIAVSSDDGARVDDDGSSFAPLHL